MSDPIISQYFNTRIPHTDTVCFLPSIPDEVDDARDNLKDKPTVVFSMAAYQMRILSMAQRSGISPIEFVIWFRRKEVILRDSYKDSIPMINRVDRALCIYALDSLIRWMLGEE